MIHYNLNTPWCDYCNSTPIEDVKSVANKHRTLYLSPELLRVVDNHPDIMALKLCKGIPEGLLFIITPEQRFQYESVLLANVLGVKSVELDGSLGEDVIGVG